MSDASAQAPEERSALPVERQDIAHVVRDEPDPSPHKQHERGVEPRAHRIERPSSSNRGEGRPALVRLLAIGLADLDCEGRTASVENWQKTLSHAGYSEPDRSSFRQSTENTQSCGRVSHLRRVVSMATGAIVAALAGLSRRRGNPATFKNLNSLKHRHFLNGDDRDSII
ncbi:hypothetical protein [Methylobacterium sp. Leaf123]|uniref:hypothetical protein n=1 Tax=Methylobacterium sp. Leaf123 TaxID=1736264 RepID=UPI001AEBE27D|nr:hypothetical protein [Methylobacterium sp. Leaf123]